MKVIKKLAALFGYQLTRRYKADMSTSALTLMNVFEHCQVNVLLDVGANVGQFAGDMRQNGYAGEIHSFEPVEQAFRRLSAASAADDKWHAHNIALGAAAGEGHINVAESTDLSSMHAPNRYGEDRYKQIKTAGVQKIMVDTVDHFLREKNLLHQNIFLKMDTQGYDVEVFKGAENSLGSIVGLQSEIAQRRLYADMPDYLTTLKAYASRGYEVVALHPISRDRNLSIIEMDCILIKIP